VITNSIRLAPKAITNVYVNFKFENKSPETIKELVTRNINKKVLIASGESKPTEGMVVGLLVEGDSAPLGIVVSFTTRVEAERARDYLKLRSEP
jgi:hypothetical protein